MEDIRIELDAIEYLYSSGFYTSEEYNFEITIIKNKYKNIYKNIEKIAGEYYVNNEK